MRWSWNCRTFSHYAWESPQPQLICITVLKCMPVCTRWYSASSTGKTLMNKVENGLERKKIRYFSLWEDVVVLQAEVEIKQKANKQKKCHNSAVAHLTWVCELCGCPRWPMWSCYIMSRSSKVTNGNYVFVTYVSTNSTKLFHIFEGTSRALASFSLECIYGCMSWQFCFGPNDW